jgi:hypothetical protein
MKKLIAILALFLLSTNSLPALAATKYPPAPTDFSNLYQNRAGISRAAWLNISKQAQLASQVKVNLQIFSGPHTNANFTTPSRIINKVASIFSKVQAPKKVYLIQYKYTDLKWAQETIKSLVSESDFAIMNRNEGGHLVDSNCNISAKSCQGSKALVSTVPEGFILEGVPNSVPPNTTEQMRFKTGQLEAHEFFHLLQDMPLFGKSLTENDWPPQWVSEGSAEWVQNAVVNSSNYVNYLKFIKADCQNMYSNPLMKKDGKYFSSYLDLKNYKTHWNTYDGWIAYNAGSRFIEMLVALSGVNSILDFYSELSNGVGFETAFKNVFGTDWATAQPILAKTLAANLRDQL